MTHSRAGAMRSAMIARWILGGSVALGASCAFADDYPGVLQQAVAAGVKIERQFPAASGLTGWVLAQGSKHSIVYTTPDKQTLILGELMNAGGESISSQYEQSYLPSPDLSPLFSRMEKGMFIAEGAKTAVKSTIYIFSDANCPYCNTMWRALKPYEKMGLQVRWVPVAVLNPTSLPKMLEVLTAKNQEDAFNAMEQRFGKPWERKTGMNEAEHKDLIRKLQDNATLMESFGITGVPGIVWRDQGGKVRVKIGMMRLSEIPLITGLPEQKNTDPVLEKYR